MISQSTKAWLQGIGTAVIGGASTAGASWMSMAMGKAIGLDVPTLNLKALGMILLAAALMNLFMYLKQSPLPAAVTTTSVTVTKEVSNSPPGS